MGFFILSRQTEFIFLNILLFEANLSLNIFLQTLWTLPIHLYQDCDHRKIIWQKHNINSQRLNQLKNENGICVKMFCITAQKFTDLLIDLDFFIIYSKFLGVHIIMHQVLRYNAESDSLGSNLSTNSANIKCLESKFAYNFWFTKCCFDYVA